MAKGKGREAKQKPGRKPEGIAETVLKGLGDMIPGLGGLLEAVAGSPAFRERLSEIDQELEARLKGAPVKQTASRPSTIPGSIPRRTAFRARPLGRRAAPPGPREPSGDVFDEGDHFKVIVELPGVSESEIQTTLDGPTLTVSTVSTASRRYHQRFSLPSAPEGRLEQRYRQGILEIRIKKTK